MLIVLNEKLGHRLKLDSIAQATFGCEKTAEGLQAIEWYRQGKLAEIAEYCLFDVKITKMVHEYGAAYNYLYYTNKFGNKLKVEINW
jgi:DEAD/DEAH box helicase domain-containing protein